MPRSNVSEKNPKPLEAFVLNGQMVLNDRICHLLHLLGRMLDSANLFTENKITRHKFRINSLKPCVFDRKKSTQKAEKFLQWAFARRLRNASCVWKRSMLWTAIWSPYKHCDNGNRLKHFSSSKEQRIKRILAADFADSRWTICRFHLHPQAQLLSADFLTLRARFRKIALDAASANSDQLKKWPRTSQVI